MKIDKKKLTDRENKPGGTFSFKTGASSLRWKSLFIVERKLLKASRTLYLVVNYDHRAFLRLVTVDGYDELNTLGW